MKYIFLLLISLFLIADSYAQDSIPRREKLSDSVKAHYFVRRLNPSVKVGTYVVYYRRKTLLVVGHYRDGKKVGTWQFFDIKGNLNQRYSYDKKKFTYEAPLYSSADFSFLFDDTLKKGDRLTRPLHIGGIYYGYLPFLNIFKVPFDTWNVDMDEFDAYIELLISPMGRLADYKIRLVSAYYQYDQIFDLDVNLFSDEDRTFLPATKNGDPVISRIQIRCFVTADGGLDFY